MDTTEAAVGGESKRHFSSYSKESPSSFTHVVVTYDIAGSHINVKSHISILMAKMNLYLCPAGLREADTRWKDDG